MVKCISKPSQTRRLGAVTASAVAIMATVGAAVGGVPAPALAAIEGAVISNDLAPCKAGSGPALLVTVSGIKATSGKIRIQTYRATKSEWMESGKWINRIETAATGPTMTFCLPVPAPDTYGVAVRHDINGNGKTDITQDGGGISNNPSINIFNLGKPSYTKVGVAVRDEVKAIRITMKYI